MTERVNGGEANKLTRALRMLKWISVAPGVDVEILGKLLDLSERGIYRYIKELRKIGIPIKTRKGGYWLEDTDILGALKLTEPGAEGIVAYSAVDDIPFLPDEV